MRAMAGIAWRAGRAMGMGCAFAWALACAGADGVSFDARTGDMEVRQDGRRLWASGEHGLWRIRFRDGSFLSAADFATNAVPGGAFRMAGAGADARLEWRSPRADVTVVSVPSADGASADLRAEVAPKTGETLMLDFPARLRFPAAEVAEFVYPGRGNSCLGLAFNSKYFLPASPDSPRNWKATQKGGRGYAHLYGRGLKMQPMNSEPVPLQVTDEGRKWFSPNVAAHIAKWKRPVIRPPDRGQSDVVLIDSPLGPYLSAKRFGGTGALWRFGVADGSSFWTPAPPAETFSVRYLLPRLAERTPARRKVALVDLASGPKVGGFVRATVDDWRRTLRAALPPGCAFEELRTIPALHRAMASSEYLFILNPYGESFPVDRAENYLACLERLRAYVQAGGNWLESGGYPFYNALAGGQYHSMTVPYPPLFADFAQLRTAAGGSVALYGVQPRPPHEPWRNPRPFIPGETGVGGDGKGGWHFHAFAAYARAGETVKTPAVRVRVGGSLDAALGDYAAANGFTTPLAAKFRDASALEKFARAPLLHLHAKASEAKRLLDGLPAPTLYHPSCYLKGGFDKEYPDHLPPSAWYGTMAEMQALYRSARAKGHLVSPYTNPTWWCDHPRGPSFVAAGEAPLAIGLDGRPYYEIYSKNDGWTTTFWHPDVQKANRKTVREFTQDAPVDLLFQDQCGARTWRWDFNPASPSPMAYVEGMLSMNEEDSSIVPIGTEDGWDRCANLQAALCGCSWRIVPTDGRPPWRTLFKDEIAPDCWRIEPVGARLFHDKTLFYMHDLGAFVTNERVLAWMLALGYNLSLSGPAKDFEANAPRRLWYDWLHVMQSRVVSRIAGRPLVRFDHDRSPLFARKGFDPMSEDDDGVVTAQWGDVSAVVNLGDVPRMVAGRRLAAYGWWIEGPGLKSAHLEGERPFVETDAGRWVYAEDPAFAPVRPTEAERATPPALRPDGPRAIGVVDFGRGFDPSWTPCAPGDWTRALEGAEWVAKHNLRVVRLADSAALDAALAGGKFFAIVNPYGERFPADGQGKWQARMAAVRRYVANGGNWVEVGGAPFFAAFWRRADGTRGGEAVGGGGMRAIGISARMDDIDELPVPLHVAPGAKGFLGAELSAQVARTSSAVNRGLVDAPDAPVEPWIVDGDGRVWFGRHRLGGWGALWRFGGANPKRELAPAVLAAALGHAFASKPLPVPENRHYRVCAVQRGETRGAAAR